MLLTKRWLGDAAAAVKRPIAAAPESERVTPVKKENADVQTGAPKKRAAVEEIGALKRERTPAVEPSLENANPPDQPSKPKRPKRVKLAEQTVEGANAPQHGDKSAKKRKKPKKDGKSERAQPNRLGEIKEEVTDQATKDKKKLLNKAKRHKSRRRTKVVGVVKEPEAAAAYLSSWAAQQAGESTAWRFNKATQAWIIRHVYEVDKVEATSFKLLLKYIDGLRGAARDRMIEDAHAEVSRGGVPPQRKDETQLSKRARLNLERRAANQTARQAELEEKKAAKAAARGKPPPKAAAEVADVAAPEATSAEQAEETPKKEETPEEIELRQTRLRRAEKVLKRLGACQPAGE